MTKAELIEVLREFPDVIMVVVGGGCTPWVDIEMVKLKLNSNLGDNTLGPHEVDEDGDTDAIYIY
jgi:hypothetical protein